MLRRVAVVGFQGCQPLDVVGPFEVFAAATAILRARKARHPGYELVLAAPELAPIAGTSGLALVPRMTLAQLAASRASRVHTLVIAGGAGAREAACEARIQRWVRRAAARVERVASVCTGAFVLGHAGLLRGKRATTHWAHCDQLAAECPEVRVEREPIYVRDGEVWTSAGVTAGIDLALAMVEEDLGGELARAVARQLVVFVRRAGGQSQFSAQLRANVPERTGLRELMAQVVEHPESVWSVPALARRVGMSERNFSRIFRAQTGSTPSTYVEGVRVETARRLLETTHQSIEEIAERAGFGTPEALRRTLQRRIGLSPREYRARFGD